MTQPDELAQEGGGTMNGLVEFIKTQLDEDERVARGAEGGWITKGPHPDDRTPVGQHMARYDPARVLREVEAKRRIISNWERLADANSSQPGEIGERAALWRALRLLALPYDDWPGYPSPRERTE